jgi:outer membrane lipopolysaccharide assembly protein LptE/RlpB
MRRFGFFFGILLLFSLGGCGYHLAGRGEVLPPDVHTLYIQMFGNRTYKAFLEDEVTNTVTEQFVQGKHLRLAENPAGANAILSGEVTAYTSRPIAYDHDDNILQYRASMTVNAVLKRAGDEKVLWKGNVTWTEAYSANQNKSVQYDNESAAIAVISERNAQELYFRIMDNF